MPTKPLTPWRKRLIEWSMLVLMLSLATAYMQRHMVSGVAPKLNGISTAEHPLSIADHPGPLLVYFWGTWCSMCRYTSPAVDDIASEYPVISVAVASGSHQEINDFMQLNHYQFPVISDDTGALSNAWGAKAFPAIYIIHDGEIVWITSGVTSQWGLQLRLWLSQWL
ncbi:protein disulfide oxidoreductase [Shewanella sp. NIFS-20-20]|uniref:protein disulfide oxidoreductase n=1 Tax=Shewanella sp. NIFS-20-20 TaxID=2853806 RepID=UPI001C45FAA9|nr:protein disulfide oxidoreductase [Shewanella sp. NIFS-20-20]MBV7314981.1 protein disulfide oxidoreductase [Shewanella sp. NIFS-20-20]